MPKYWVKNYFAHGRFPEVGQKQKTEKERKKEREKERLNDGDNNGQATHGARKPPGPPAVPGVSFSLFSLSLAFDPLRGISRVRKFVSPNILA